MQPKKSKQFSKSYSAIYKTFSSSICNCFNNKETEHIARLRIGLCHLHDHKVKQGFRDSFNQVCSCELILKQLAIIYSIAQFYKC